MNRDWREVQIESVQVIRSGYWETRPTHDYAQLLRLTGPRTPYPGELGVVKEGALADLLLVDGNPLENLDLVADPDRRFVVIVKDGIVYKNSLR